MALNKVGPRHVILVDTNKEEEELSDGNLSSCYSDDEKQADIILRQNTCGDTVLDENKRKQVKAFRCEHTRDELENATKDLLHRNYPRDSNIDRQQLEKQLQNNNALRPGTTSDHDVTPSDDLANPAVWQSIAQNMHHWDPYQRYTLDTRFVPEQYRELVESLTRSGSGNTEPNQDDEDTQMLLKSDSEIEDSQLPRHETFASNANVRERYSSYAEGDKMSGGEFGHFRQADRLAGIARSPRRIADPMVDKDRVTPFNGEGIARSPCQPLTGETSEETDSDKLWHAELISKWSPYVEVPTRDFEVVNTKPEVSQLNQGDIVPVVRDKSPTKGGSDQAKRTSVWDCLICK